MQFAFAREQADTALPVEEVLRRIGISKQTLSLVEKALWRLWAAEFRRLKQLEDERGTLEQLAADLILDELILHDVIAKKSSDICSAT